MKDAFIKYFNLDNIVSEIELHAIQKRIQTRKVKKGEGIQSAGDAHRSVFFVKEGLLRSFIVDDKGKEHIYMFAPEGWIISDVEFVSQEDGATLYIDAIEDSEIEVIPQELINDVEKLMLKSDPKYYAIERKRLFKRIGVLQKRILLLLSANAMERYDEFVRKYPNITQRVPQKMIASYLGITPEALSKMKSQQLKKKVIS